MKGPIVILAIVTALIAAIIKLTSFLVLHLRPEMKTNGWIDYLFCGTLASIAVITPITLIFGIVIVILFCNDKLPAGIGTGSTGPR